MQAARAHAGLGSARTPGGIEMSKTLVVIAAVLAVLVTYHAVQPKGRERAQATFSEVSAWVQARF